MATITLYRMTQDKKVVNKTLTSANTIASVTASFKGDCTITDPVIELDYDTGYLQANYMYISDFGRYYFIEQTVVSEQRIIYSCHVDVLKSFTGDIRNMTALVSRSEKNYNLYLNDKYFKVLNYKNDEVFEFPEDTKNRFTNKFYSYVLVVAGAMPTPPN